MPLVTTGPSHPVRLESPRSHVWFYTLSTNEVSGADSDLGLGAQVLAFYDESFLRFG